jgi:hypothetical protein
MINMQIFAKALLEQIEVARVRQLSGLQESFNTKHSDTARAISIFQKYVGLDQTGTPDPKTMHYIEMIAEGNGQTPRNPDGTLKGVAPKTGSEASGFPMTPSPAIPAVATQPAAKAPAAKAPAGGYVGQNLAALGVTKAQRLDQAYVDKILGPGKFKAGSAEANLALQKATATKATGSGASGFPMTPSPPAGDGGVDPYVSNGQSTIPAPAPTPAPAAPKVTPASALAAAKAPTTSLTANSSGDFNPEAELDSTIAKTRANQAPEVPAYMPGNASSAPAAAPATPPAAPPTPATPAEIAKIKKPDGREGLPDSEEDAPAFDPTWGGTKAAADTRTGLQKVLPNFMGGKSAPVAANQNATWDNKLQRAVSNAPAANPAAAPYDPSKSVANAANYESRLREDPELTAMLRIAGLR